MVFQCFLWKGGVPLHRRIVPLLLAISCPLLFADQVVFKNGDRLTGAIRKSDTKNLVIRTAVAGEVAVLWQEIQEIRSDLPLHVELSDGRILASRMTAGEENVEIVTDAGALLKTPREKFVALRDDTEQAAFEKSRSRRLLTGWDGSLDAGIDLTRGNSDTENFRLAFRAVRVMSRDRFAVYAASLRSFDDLPHANPHTTVDESRGGAFFDHDYLSRFFAFGNADFMSDGLQDLNLRSVLGGGIGYHLVKTERATFDLLGGVNFTHEDYDEIQRSLLAGQVGEELNFKLGGNTSLNQTFAYFPDLTDPGANYRTNFNLLTVTRIVKWFGWQNNLSDMYVTNPPAGKKQNELAFTSGLRLTFSNLQSQAAFPPKRHLPHP
jgi:putative salt-induced outer membrane protein YdiY